MMERQILSPNYQLEIENSHHDSTFLTILCRRHRDRANLYADHMESIVRQYSHIDGGIQHISIFGAQSVGEANGILGHPQLTDHIQGHYVMVLDDDDRFAQEGAVDQIEGYANLCASVTKTLPEWIMISGSVSDRKDGPFPLPWGNDWLPVRGSIPSFCMVVRNDAFARAQRGWRVEKAGDWMFSRVMWELGYRPCWLDSQEPLVETIRVSHGKGES